MTGGENKCSPHIIIIMKKNVNVGALKRRSSQLNSDDEFDASQYVQPYEEDLYRFIFSLFL